MTLEHMFRERGAIKRIGVIGMGYVGIPSSLLFADSAAFDFVYGFQRTSTTSGYKIDLLNSGVIPFKGNEPGLDQLLRKVIAAKKFQCTSDFSILSGLDAVTVTVQTPFLNKDTLTPDLSSLLEGLSQIGRYLQPGQLIVIESTITPGTTDQLVKDTLEQNSGMVAGVDFGLAHAPERVMSGKLLHNITHLDRIIGGIDRASSDRAGELYRPILKEGKIITMTATAAETTKTAENALRDLQIAAVNQLALYCEAMRVNIYDVRRGIISITGEGNTRAMLNPGAGVGGHCLIKDTYHLERGIEKLGKCKLDYPLGERSLFVLARQINDFMPTHMLHLTKDALAVLGKCLEETTVAILGWSYLADTDDARNTPAEPYRQSLLRAGAKVIVHDPYVGGYAITDNLSDAIQDVDAIIVFTAHTGYRNLNPEWVKERTGKAHPIIIDGRNVIDPDAFIDCGFVYKGIGRGDKNYMQAGTWLMQNSFIVKEYGGVVITRSLPNG